MNTINEFIIRSDYDDLDISVMTVAPQGEIKAVFQFVHGMCEHKERYIPLMEYLAGNGYACIVHDHRGHGKSVKSPDDLGYFYKGGANAMIEDSYKVTQKAKELFPGRDVVLFGHSMGSMVVRSYVKRHDDAISALIVCGSPSDNPLKGIGKALAGLIGIFRGFHHRPDSIHGMSFNAFEKKFASDGRKNAWVCSDDEMLSAYNADPLCLFHFTANGFIGLFGLMQEAYSKKGWKMSNPDLPIMFISGADDPCLGNMKKFGKAVGHMRKLGYKNVESRVYEGMRHEIHNETKRSIVWQDILDFADAAVIVKGLS